MLWFEREVVEALGTVSDQPTQSSVEAFVDGSLRAMPEHIRAGVAASSLLLGGYISGLQLIGSVDHSPATLRRRLDRWETSPIGPLRQYVRMFRSLVLFGENEADPAKAVPAALQQAKAPAAGAR